MRTQTLWVVGGTVGIGALLWWLTRPAPVAAASVSKTTDPAAAADSLAPPPAATSVPQPSTSAMPLPDVVPNQAVVEALTSARATNQMRYVVGLVITGMPDKYVGSLATAADVQAFFRTAKAAYCGKNGVYGAFSQEVHPNGSWGQNWTLSRCAAP